MPVGRRMDVNPFVSVRLAVPPGPPGTTMETEARDRTIKPVWETEFAIKVRSRFWPLVFDLSFDRSLAAFGPHRISPV